MTQRQVPPEFLIIAASARFIAQSAAACGYALSTIDGFADAEVRLLSRCAERVPLSVDGLSVGHLRRACERLLRARRIAGIIVGPGLDAHPQFIDWLNTRAPVYANTGDVFSRCRDRRRFVEELDRLGIPHPREGSGAGSPALLKVAGASGGAHVHFGTEAEEPGAAYRQSYLPGIARSYLFLAGGSHIRSIGWNTQWQSRHDENHPFCYGGALNRSVPDVAVDSRVEDYAQRLAQAFSLAGINSIDYVVVGGEVYLLELNPRISATMQLHDTGGALFAAHLDACLGTCVSAAVPAPVAAEPRAHAVLHAAHPVTLPAGFEWPVDACDLPGGNSFSMGDPICTLLASAPTPAATLTSLQQGIRLLTARFAATRRPVATDTDWITTGRAMA